MYLFLLFSAAGCQIQPNADPGRGPFYYLRKNTFCHLGTNTLIQICLCTIFSSHGHQIEGEKNCLKLQNIYVWNCKIYLSQIAKYICQLPILENGQQAANWHMYLSLIVKYICLKLQNIFVSNSKMYLSLLFSAAGRQIRPNADPGRWLTSRKLTHVFVCYSKIYLSQIAKYICLK